VPAAAVGSKLFGGSARDDLVKDGFLVARFAEDAPEPLNVLAHRARSGEHDRDIGLGDVDSLVEYARRSDDRIGSGVKTQQNLAPFFGLGLVRDHWNQELSRDFVNGGVVVSEDQHPVAVVAFEQPREQVELGRSGQRQLALLAVGVKGFTTFR
jgi:hypothetical protein